MRIENQRLEWNVESRVGSTKNIKHRAGGGNVKVYCFKVIDCHSIFHVHLEDGLHRLILKFAPENQIKVFIFYLLLRDQS